MMKSFFLIVLIILSHSLPAQKSVLKKQISDITEGKKATVAVSVRGIDFPFSYNNENATKLLPTLSVFKFHIALAALDLVDQGKLKLNQKILIKKEDLLPNTHSPYRDEHPNGNVYASVEEIIYYAVAVSDNNLTDVLLRQIGGPAAVQKFIDSRKVKQFQIKYNEEQMHQGAEFVYPNQTSVQSLSNLYRDFYNGKIVSASSRDFLYRVLLSTSTGANKLKEQLPRGTVAHKTGSSGTNDQGFTIAENDSGVVTLRNGKHYAISIFVVDSNESYETNCRMVSEISKKVWDYLNQ